jgi:hypothetical protein
MSQTNIQVPIEQRNHDREVLEKRPVLLGDERFKPEGRGVHPPGGPSSLGQDDKFHPLVRCHSNLGGHEQDQLAVEAPDLLYGERMGGADPLSGNAGCDIMGDRKRFMSGRRHAGSHLNCGRNVGSEHLAMEAQSHDQIGLHKKEGPPALGEVLPKDQ